MADKTAILVAAGIAVPLAFLLIYFGFRKLTARTGEASQAIDSETARRRTIDSAGLRQAESKVAVAPASRSTSFEDPRDEARAAGAKTNIEIAAYFSEQAKRSDEARRSQMRAHVERPVPPTTAEGQAAIDLGKGARISIKHVFPPRLPQRSMSYFGGLPIVPGDDFDWPTVHNREGVLERLNFMAQIDCSDLPPGRGRHLLPDKGYLYFFAPMSDSFGPDALHFVTRYLPGPVRKSWEPVDMPATSKIEPADPIDLAWHGKRTHFDRFEVDFGWIEEPSDDEVAARADEGHAFEVAEKIRGERLEAFYGPLASTDPLLAAYKAPKEELWAPYKDFPANWKTAQILRKFVETYQREESMDVSSKLKVLTEAAKDHPQIDADEPDPDVERLKALQVELLRFGSRISDAFGPVGNMSLKPFGPPPDEVKEQIMAFMRDLRANGMPSSKERPYQHLALPQVLNKWLEFSAVHGAEEGLSDSDGAALIPPDVVAALAARHGSREHQMFGEGIVVQVAADQMKDSYLLLLQLGRDPALNWTIGEMGPLQYWITPEDLAAKRFENTILTIEAY